MLLVLVDDSYPVMDAGGPREGQEGATIPRPLLRLHSSWLPEPDR